MADLLEEEEDFEVTMKNTVKPPASLICCSEARCCTLSACAAR